MKLIFVILVTILNYSSCSEILCIFPMPMHSHLTVYNTIIMELVKRGHKITLLSASPRNNEKNHENITVIDLSFATAEYHKSIEDFLTKNEGNELTKKFVNLISSEFSSPEVQNLAKSDKKFDLMIVENVGFSPFHAFAEHFNIPVIGINSADASAAGHEIMGNVFNPIAHPDRLLGFPMAKTFFERLGSTIYWIAFRYFMVPMVATECDKITEKYFPKNKIKDYYELVSNVDLLLINAHPVMGFIRPILPNTIALGFTHINPPEPLPGILQEILDKNVNGVIFVSFGTVFKIHYFRNILRKLFEAFERLPYLVLFKYDGELESVPNNVILQKWFPQVDLLAHPNVKVFITHGGQQSMEESIIRRVPMLIIPIVSDQRANAIRAENRQIGTVLDIHKNDKINSNDIKNSILDLVNNNRYKTNIENLAKLVEDVPMTSREKAVWWIEYVIRNHGAKHFHYEQRNIPFYQYHYYDVIAFIVAVIVLIIVTIVLILRCTARCFKSLMNFKSKRD